MRERGGAASAHRWRDRRLVQALMAMELIGGNSLPACGGTSVGSVAPLDDDNLACMGHCSYTHSSSGLLRGTAFRRERGQVAG